MLDTEDIERRIKAIPVKTKAARLRPLLPLIDKRIKEGVTHREILDTLHECGIEITLRTCQTYLRRYRKKQSASPRAEPAKPAARPEAKKEESAPAAKPAATPGERGKAQPRPAGSRKRN